MSKSAIKISSSPVGKEVSSSKSAILMDKNKVWAPDPNRGFILGRINDISEDGAWISPIDSEEPLYSSFESLYPAEDEKGTDKDDNCGLMYLNEATLLNNVRIRYEKDKIYTYVANILIAVNPYIELKDLYSSKTISAYKGRSLGTMPPHVFAIADKAFRDMKVLKRSQSIIVSGESGAGKTESTKYILKYLCDNFGSGVGSLEKKILNTNPILESFGNAKTIRNNNSSRFGKFIEIHFDKTFKVVGGFISHYLLERARVVHQGHGERNYHIFYQICAGAPKELYDKLHLAPPDQFQYLKFGCTQYFGSRGIDKKRLSKNGTNSLLDPMLNDAEDFNVLNNDLKNLGMTLETRESVYATIAAVLHLGNINFEEDVEDTRGGSRISDNSLETLNITASLLGLDSTDLKMALTARVMQASKEKGTIIMVPLKVNEASNARDALAKALYSRLFDFIVSEINKSIPFAESSYYIGVLDIAGFEYFTVNSFEQFCINYCNEKLQQFFNQRILKDEQDLYEKEGLGVKKISFLDNQDCIDLIEAKGTGIFSLLDEESKLPKSSYTNFTASVHSLNSKHFRLSLPRKSKLKEHRGIRDDAGILVRHFAGAVCYQTALFIEKNNDSLHASLEALAQESKNEFIRELFNDKGGPVARKQSSAIKGKLTFISVGSKFKSQLQELMDKLKSTGTNFIRCIKPNVNMIPHCFEGGSILSQLQCAGMTSVLELMQQGFPSRTLFSELYEMYKEFIPKELSRLSPRLFCKALFKALGLNDNDFKFGMTKVFFRPGKFAEFDQILKSDPENLKLLISKVKKWIVQNHWKKTQWCSLSVIKLRYKIVYRNEARIILQKNIKMFLAKTKHAHRYKGILKLKKLMDRVSDIQSLSKELKTHKSLVEKEIDCLISSIEKAIVRIKVNDLIAPATLSAEHSKLMASIQTLILSVKSYSKKEKIAEEQEKIKKLQQDMERQRKEKEEEEAKIRQLEEESAQLAKIENRRKEEEQMDKLRQYEEDRNKALKLQKELDEDNKRLRLQLEQERRDHELALRLAKESSGPLDDSTPALKRSPAVIAMREERAGEMYNLSKWKYAELRDTINSSCDLFLINCCREEFCRRLKVYQAWRERNSKKNAVIDENIRLPPSLMSESRKEGVTPSASERKNGNSYNKEQRYFRIPFVADDPSKSGKGWWYAHFDGDWVGRQMEVRPDKSPVLLICGQNDIQMCELSLQETGLTKKKGAEILEHQFEREWIKNGGSEYVSPASRMSVNGVKKRDD